jgi:hypothetical protein
MIMGLLKNSVIIDELNYLVRLYVLRDPFLGLDEQVESLELSGHMVYGIINCFFNLDEFMIVTIGSHL